MFFALNKGQSALAALILLIGGFWMLLFWQLGFEWLYNPQYQYGLAVPCIGAYLVYLRYLDSPTPKPHPLLQRTLPSATCFLLLGFYPLAIVFEANADWRLLPWLMALGCFVHTVWALSGVGGLGWMRHFSCAFLFFLCAVPWPSAVEGVLVQELLKWVSASAVEFLHLMGVPALQMGNIIQVPGGLVSMEDACSGVRSFQSSLMLGYFLGELFRLGLGHRLFLLCLGPLSAVGFNILRTLFIALLVDAKGSVFANSWHGLASQLVFMACLGHLALWACLLRKKAPAPKPRSQKAATALSLGFSLPWALGVFAVALFSGVFAKLWYGLFPPRLPYERVGWYMQWDRLGEGARMRDVPPSIKERLLYDAGQLVQLQLPEGGAGLAYYFSWERMKAAQLGGFHGPELCLPALGWGPAQEGPLLVWEKQGVQLVFRSFKFRRSPQKIYVFFVQWDQSAYPYHKKSGRFRKDRLLEAWQRHRSPRKTSLELVLAGPKSFAEAQKAAETILEKALVVVQ